MDNKNNSKTLVIRSDADLYMGTGHVMRCIALGQLWQDYGGTVIFVTCCHNKKIIKRLQDEKFQVVELDNSADFFSVLNLRGESLLPKCWVVLDGYHFDLEYQKRVRVIGYKLLLIDDYNHFLEYECDILLNQNLNHSDFTYCVNSDCEKLFGLGYALLRREFREWIPRRSVGKSCNILVIMGGADEFNVTLKVLELLTEGNLPSCSIRVVLGPSNPHRNVLRKFTNKTALNLTLLDNVYNMPALLEWADFAISAAGSICFEFIYMHLSAGLIITAENQRREAELLGNTKQFSVLGDVDSFDKKVLLQYVFARIKCVEFEEFCELTVGNKLSDLLQKMN